MERMKEALKVCAGLEKRNAAHKASSDDHSGEKVAKHSYMTSNVQSVFKLWHLPGSSLWAAKQ